MRKSWFTENQILAIVGEGEAGLAEAEVCRKHGISSATYYQWKSKYAGMSVDDIERLKMSHKQSLTEIFFHLVKKHPELLADLPQKDAELSDFERSYGFRGVFQYKKDLNCQLAALCDKYGSDKGEIESSGHPYPWPSHSYSDYYRRLWGHCRSSVRNVFECGLGTNNPNLPSSMGISGKPGASLRVWRDYFPNAMIYGADIDKDILFSEDRIISYFVDQTSPESISRLWEKFEGIEFDFMIDDGLHVFEAGACLFENSIQKLAPYGVYVIEDVSHENLRKYKQFFNSQPYLVDFVSLHRPKLNLGDNNLVVIRSPDLL
jgi:hypothetical protein